MSAIYEGSSVLTLGEGGAVGAEPFSLIARACLRGRRGSIWNEWTLRLADGRPRYLAEASGVFTLYDETSLVPEWDDLAPGRAPFAGLVVVERGEATRVAVWGEAASGPEVHRYAVLSRPGESRRGEAITVAYGAGEGARVFVGRRVRLAELGLTCEGRPVPRWIPTPDVSRPHGVHIWLNPGDEGDLDDRRVRIMGAISRRSAEERWDEYALYDVVDGLRWLVVADGHWSLVTPAPPPPMNDAGRSDGREIAVEWATGELPWEVKIGELASIREDGELTIEETADEVSCARATPLPPDAIAKAFGKRLLPRPRPA